MGVGFGVGGDFLKDIFYWGDGLPIPQAAGAGVMENDPRGIERAGPPVGDDFVRAEAVVAPVGQLPQRSGGGNPSGKIKGTGNAGVRGTGQLLP
jgi:hypothetical protein